MRLLRAYRFLKITVILIVLCFGLYLLVVSGFFNNSISPHNNLVKNVDKVIKSKEIKPQNDLYSEKNEKEKVYNVWCIFTKVTSNSPIKRKFRIFVDSLLKYSSTGTVFHVVTDEESKIIAEQVIEYNFLVNNKTIKVGNG